MTTLERLDALIERGVFYDCDWDTLKAVREGSGELLEALEAFAAHFGPLHDNEWLNDEVRRCFSLARTAIRKAKGEA